MSVIRASLRDEKVDGEDAVKIDRIVAHAGETVCWDPGDRVVSIWFPDAGVFTTPVLAVMHKGEVEATIRADAPRGKVFEYAIFCHDTGKFVTCESHPKIEIPGP